MHLQALNATEASGKSNKRLGLARLSQVLMHAAGLHRQDTGACCGQECVGRIKAGGSFERW